MKEEEEYNSEVTGKVLHMFTGFYPYSMFEIYLNKEVEFLSNKFETIYIYPFKTEGEKRLMPENCVLVDYSGAKFFKASIATLFFKNFVKVFFLFIHQLRAIGFRKFISNFSAIKAYVFQSLRYYHAIKERFKDSDEKVLLYSNWFVNWSTVLALLKEKNYDKFSLVVKAHRYDVYEEEYHLGFIPLRNWEINVVDKICLISQNGLDYLSKRFPEQSHKMELFRLGSGDHGVNPNGFGDKLVIVTCSNLKPVKRLHLLIEALMQVREKITWHHFGDGDQRVFFEQEILKLPHNISVCFYGRIASEKLFEFYRSNHVDLFINISSSEGIPVSLMEATSFGIPLIGTNAGGNAEIICPQTGMLLEVDFSMDELVQIIHNFRSSVFATEQFRKGVRDYWLTHFNAEINADRFARFMSSMIK